MRLAGRFRTTHAYVIGATRSGKTKALEAWIRQDIAAGRGVGVLDPHGDLIGDLLAWVAARGDIDPARLVLVDPTSPDGAVVGFNPLEVASEAELYPLILELVGAFKRIWGDSWGARMEEILRNSCVALASHGFTLLEAHNLLTDADFRAHCCMPPTPAATADYWRERFAAVPDKDRSIWVESTLNKVNALVADPRLSAILGQAKSTFSLRTAMDTGQIVLVNLASGMLKDNAALFGALLLAKLQAAAMSRVDTPKEKRRLFAVYIDEFQAITSDSFGEVLAQAGKFQLALHLAHQNLAQVDEQLRAAILGNCGTQAVFRVGREDAELLAKQLFRVSGEVVKRVERNKKTGEEKAIRYNLAEERELHVTSTLDQEQRCCCVRTPAGGPWKMQADLVEPARPAPEAVAALRAAAARQSARPRAEVEAEIEARRAAIRRGRYAIPMTTPTTTREDEHHDHRHQAEPGSAANPEPPARFEDPFGDDAAD